MLLYTQYFDYSTTDVWRTNADGTGAANLTVGFSRDLNPAWSPDGTRIAFVSDRDHNDPFQLDASEMYLMQADGTGPVRVTADVIAARATTGWPAAAAPTDSPAAPGTTSATTSET